MSGGIKMEWRGDELLRQVESEMNKRLDAAAEVVRAEAVRSIRTPYPPASTAGNPPHSRSGASGLFGSVFHRPESRFKRIIGTPLKYGLYLEVGTSKMAARPWLRPALNRSLERIKKIICKPLPRK